MRKKNSKKILASLVLSMLMIVNVFANSLAPNNVFNVLTDSFVPINISDYDMSLDLDGDIDVDMIRDLYVDTIMVDDDDSYMDTIDSDVAEFVAMPRMASFSIMGGAAVLIGKGCMAFAGVAYTWYATSIATNAYTKDLEAADAWIARKWDDISKYFQSMPIRSKAIFTRISENVTNAELKAAYPGITDEDLDFEIGDAVSRSFLMNSVIGFSGAMKDLIANELGDPPIPKAKPENNYFNVNTVDFLSPTYFRTFNTNVEIRPSVNYINLPTTQKSPFPDDFPYACSYRIARLSGVSKYMYGVEVKYEFRNLSGEVMQLLVSYFYKANLAGASAYQGLTFTNNILNNTSYGINYTLKTSLQTYYSASMYPTGNPVTSRLVAPSASSLVVASNIASYIYQYAGIEMDIDTTYWFSFIDIAPFPSDVVVNTGKDNSTMYGPYVPIYTKNDYNVKVPIIAPSEIPTTVLNHDNIVNNGIPPATSYTVIQPYYDTVTNVTPGYVGTIPTVDDEVPLPNPFPDINIDVDVVIPEIDLGIPDGFFDKILWYLDNFWDWMCDFFTNIWKSFSDTMLSLFIPPSGWLESAFDGFKDDILESFGFTQVDELGSLGNVDAIKPDFGITIYGQQVQLVDLSFYERYKGVIQGLISAVLGVFLFLYNIRMIQWLIRGKDFMNKGGDD